MELLERESFLGTLAGYAREARQGDGRLVLVSGESGSARRRCSRRSSSSSRGPLAVGSLRRAADAAAARSPVRHRGAGGRGACQLCRQGAPRDQLFAAFLAEIGSPAAFTVAVMEDVHWADEATIDLLNFLGRRLSRRNALVLVTYRDDEVGADHPLRIVLGDLATQRATRRMRLPPLSEKAVRLLAATSATSTPPSCTGSRAATRSTCARCSRRAGRRFRPRSGTRSARGWPAERRPPARSWRPRPSSAPGWNPRYSPRSIPTRNRRLDQCLETGLLIGGRRLTCGSGTSWCGWPLMPGFRRIARPGCTPGCLPLSKRGRRGPCPARPPRGRGRRLLGRAPARPGSGEALVRAGRAPRGSGASTRGHCGSRATPISGPAPVVRGLATEYSLLDRWRTGRGRAADGRGAAPGLGDVRARRRGPVHALDHLWRQCRGRGVQGAAERRFGCSRTCRPGAELAWAYASRWQLPAMDGNSTRRARALRPTPGALAERLGHLD